MFFTGTAGVKHKPSQDRGWRAFESAWDDDGNGVQLKDGNGVQLEDGTNSRLKGFFLLAGDCFLPSRKTYERLVVRGRPQT